MKIINRIAALMMGVAIISSQNLTASANIYNREIGKTTGGTGGTAKYECYVFDYIYSGENNQMKHKYGVKGGLVTDGLKTTWTGYGTLYTTNNSKNLTRKTTTGQSQSREISISTTSTKFVTYSLHMNSSSNSFGKSTYYKNGSFTK